MYLLNTNSINSFCLLSSKAKDGRLCGGNSCFSCHWFYVAVKHIFQHIKQVAFFSVNQVFAKWLIRLFQNLLRLIFLSSVRLVIGLLQSVRNSSSLLKRLGNSPNRLFKNSSAEIGLPSALQNEVEIIDCISRSFPSFNFTFIFCRLFHLQILHLQIFTRLLWFLFANARRLSANFARLWRWFEVLFDIHKLTVRKPHKVKHHHPIQGRQNDGKHLQSHRL